MKIAVTGGTGFIGRPLVARLHAAGHEVTVLTRSPERAGGFPEGVALAEFPSGEALPPERLGGAEAVIDLAGENVGGKRWNAEVKRALKESRTEGTSAIVEASRAAGTVRALLCASAVGFYGDRGEEPLPEEAGPGGDFLAEICRAREAVALRAEEFGIRTVLLRVGIVLHPSGGALERMMLPFKLGAGGPLGSGRQYFPWIHREDAVRMIEWALLHEQVRGPLNVASPKPVPNRDFARALGRAMKRPALMPTPKLALKLALGEMAEGILAGQRVVPKRALEGGFTFEFPDVDAALADLLRK